MKYATASKFQKINIVRFLIIAIAASVSALSTASLFASPALTPVGTISSPTGDSIRFLMPTEQITREMRGHIDQVIRSKPATERQFVQRMQRACRGQKLTNTIGMAAFGAGAMMSLRELVSESAEEYIGDYSGFFISNAMPGHEDDPDGVVNMVENTILNGATHVNLGIAVFTQMFMTEAARHVGIMPDVCRYYLATPNPVALRTLTAAQAADPTTPNTIQKQISRRIYNRPRFARGSVQGLGMGVGMVLGKIGVDYLFNKDRLRCERGLKTRFGRPDTFQAFRQACNSYVERFMSSGQMADYLSFGISGLLSGALVFYGMEAMGAGFHGLTREAQRVTMDQAVRRYGRDRVNAAVAARGGGAAGSGRVARQMNVIVRGMMKIRNGVAAATGGRAFMVSLSMEIVGAAGSWWLTTNVLDPIVNPMISRQAVLGDLRCLFTGLTRATTEVRENRATFRSGPFPVDANSYCDPDNQQTSVSEALSLENLGNAVLGAVNPTYGFMRQQAERQARESSPDFGRVWSPEGYLYGISLRFQQYRMKVTEKSNGLFSNWVQTLEYVQKVWDSAYTFNRTLIMAGSHESLRPNALFLDFMSNPTPARDPFLTARRQLQASAREKINLIASNDEKLDALTGALNRFYNCYLDNSQPCAQERNEKIAALPAELRPAALTADEINSLRPIYYVREVLRGNAQWNSIFLTEMNHYRAMANPPAVPAAPTRQQMVGYIVSELIYLLNHNPRGTSKFALPASRVASADNINRYLRANAGMDEGVLNRNACTQAQGEKDRYVLRRPVQSRVLPFWGNACDTEKQSHLALINKILDLNAERMQAQPAQPLAELVGEVNEGLYEVLVEGIGYPFQLTPSIEIVESLLKAQMPELYERNPLDYDTDFFSAFSQGTPFTLERNYHLYRFNNGALGGALPENMGYSMADLLTEQFLCSPFSLKGQAGYFLDRNLLEVLSRTVFEEGKRPTLYMPRIALALDGNANTELPVCSTGDSNTRNRKMQASKYVDYYSIDRMGQTLMRTYMAEAVQNLNESEARQYDGMRSVDVAPTRFFVNYAGPVPALPAGRDFNSYAERNIKHSYKDFLEYALHHVDPTYLANPESFESDWKTKVNEPVERFLNEMSLRYMKESTKIYDSMNYIWKVNHQPRNQAARVNGGFGPEIDVAHGRNPVSMDSLATFMALTNPTAQPQIEAHNAFVTRYIREVLQTGLEVGLNDAVSTGDINAGAYSIDVAEFRTYAKTLWRLVGRLTQANSPNSLRPGSDNNAVKWAIASSLARLDYSIRVAWQLADPFIISPCSVGIQACTPNVDENVGRKVINLTLRLLASGTYRYKLSGMEARLREMANQINQANEGVTTNTQSAFGEDFDKLLRVYQIDPSLGLKSMYLRDVAPQMQAFDQEFNTEMFTAAETSQAVVPLRNFTRANITLNNQQRQVRLKSMLFNLAIQSMRLNIKLQTNDLNERMMALVNYTSPATAAAPHGIVFTADFKLKMLSLISKSSEMISKISDRILIESQVWFDGVAYTPLNSPANRFYQPLVGTIESINDLVDTYLKNAMGMTCDQVLARDNMYLSRPDLQRSTSCYFEALGRTNQNFDVQNLLEWETFGHVTRAQGLGRAQEQTLRRAN